MFAPLSVQYLDKCIGYYIAQWDCKSGGQLSVLLTKEWVDGIFYHQNTLKNKSYPGLICLWKVTKVHEKKMTFGEVKELEHSIKNNGAYPPWTNGLCSLYEGMKIIQKYQSVPEWTTGYYEIFYGKWTGEFTESDIRMLFELNWGISELFGDHTFYHFH